MTESHIQNLLEAAIDFARQGGSYALENTHRRGEIHKQTPNDIKLKLDFETQEQIEKAIQKRFPGSRILGEEGDTEGDASKPLWIVDPIDGTVNFSHGLPLWCCSVAVEHDGKTVAGAVYVPVLDECYSASINGPATCNGEIITVSEEKSLDKTIMVTGLPKNMGHGNRASAYFHALAEKVQRPRIFGSAAIDLCFTACGRCDLYMEHGIYIWDVAAGMIILQQAGGRCEIIERFDDDRIAVMGSNPYLFEQADSLVRSARRHI